MAQTGEHEKAYSILFVDDEPLVLDLFKQNFEEKFRIFTTTSIPEAFDLVERENVALILADQRMPILSGTEFFAEIQKTHPEIIRILVTGYIDFRTMVAAINAGHVYHYVEKPWDDEELELIIRRALEHFHLVIERDRLQAERIRTLEKMARSNRLEAVGTLAAGMAHEIRNPLSAIITFHQMLPEKIQELAKHPDTLHEDFWTKFSKISLREVERIKRLVQELLDFSRDSGSQYQMKKVRLQDVVETFLPILESDLRNHGIQLMRDFDPELPEIEVDPDKIKQVVLNLLLNSMHATPEDGTIYLRLKTAAEKSGFCQIEVEDTGAGIDPQDIERVFDPFFTTRDPGTGTGLGLTMCHHIVTNHGGEISLKSALHQGTCVTLFLPFHTPAKPTEFVLPGSSLSSTS